MCFDNKQEILKDGNMSRSELLALINMLAEERQSLRRENDELRSALRLDRLSHMEEIAKRPLSFAPYDYGGIGIVNE